MFVCVCVRASVCERTVTLVSSADVVEKDKKNTIFIHLSTTFYVYITSAVLCCVELSNCLGNEC